MLLQLNSLLRVLQQQENTFLYIRNCILTLKTGFHSMLYILYIRRERTVVYQTLNSISNIVCATITAAYHQLINSGETTLKVYH